MEVFRDPKTGGIYREFYEKTEVDKEIESLKASHYAEMCDEGMKNRKLRRMLYFALRKWAEAEKKYAELDSSVFMDGMTSEAEVSWEKMAERCKKLEERYKCQ